MPCKVQRSNYAEKMPFGIMKQHVKKTIVLNTLAMMTMTLDVKNYKMCTCKFPVSYITMSADHCNDEIG